MQKSAMGAELFVTKTAFWQQVRRFLEMLTYLGLGILFGIVAWHVPQDRYYSMQEKGIGLALMIPFCLGLLYAALKECWHFFHAFGHELRVYEGGIKHQQAGKSQSWRWDELDALIYHSQIISINMMPMHNFKMKLRSKDGAIIYIDKIYNDYRGLSELLLELTRQAWTKRDLKALQAGETLHYGKISLSKQGFSQGHILIPWNAVQRIDNLLDLRFQIVTTDDRAMSFTLNKVWNGHVLLSVVNTIIEKQLKRTSQSSET